MTRRPAILVIAVAFLAVLPTVRALAGPLDEDDSNRKDAECFIDKDDVLSPGLSLSPSSGGHARARGHRVPRQGQRRRPER